MNNNSNGNYNTATGYESLFSNSSGNSNTGIGFGALKANTNGNFNTAAGVNALWSNTANYNTATGNEALFANTVGAGNTAAGNFALRSNVNGANNSAFGINSLISNSTGSNNSALGFGADVSAGNLTNATAIGSGAIVNASNKIRIGNSSVTVIEGQVAYTFPSDGRFKTNVSENIRGLDFIMKLRPVAYNFQTKKYDEFIKGPVSRTSDNTDIKFAAQSAYTESERILHNGFIAQEVEKAAKECGYQFDGVIVPKNSTETYGLSYSQFVVPLVKAVQEQQQIIKDQNKKIDKLQQQMDLLIKEMQSLKEKK